MNNDTPPPSDGRALWLLATRALMPTLSTAKEIGQGENHEAPWPRQPPSLERVNTLPEAPDCAEADLANSICVLDESSDSDEVANAASYGQRAPAAFQPARQLFELILCS